MLREGPAPSTCHIQRLQSERGFRLSGDLDLMTVEAVREALQPELRGTLVLDLAGVRFTDDSGVGLLVGTYRQLRQHGGSLVLRSPREPVTRVLEITGIDRLEGLRIERDG